MKKEIINKEFDLYSGDVVVVKVGSNVLAGKDVGVNLKNLKNLVESINYLMKIGLNVLLVSSGAVAVGKEICNKNGINYNDNLSDNEKSYLSKLGWGKLLALYIELFEKKGITAGGTLLTHDNFKNKQELENIVWTWEEGFKNKTLDIINENDVVSREEFGFSDNDELAGLIAEAICAKILILLSDIDGLSKNYKQENEELVEVVNNIENVRKYSVKVKNGVGKGQMDSKLNVMNHMIENGIIGILANGTKKRIIEKIFKGEESRKTIFRV